MQALQILKRQLSKDTIEKAEQTPNGWAHHLPLPQRNPLLMGKTPEKFLIDTIRTVKAQELEQALMLLNFSTASTFIAFLERWIEQGKYLELCCRCLFSLLKTHNNQITSNQAMVETLARLQHSVRAQLQKFKVCAMCEPVSK
jgi:U3 small nucleolar RNA-associated protein 12